MKMRSRVKKVSTMSEKFVSSNTFTEPGVGVEIDRAVSLVVSLAPVTSVYTTCAVSASPHVTRPSSADSGNTFEMPMVSLRKIPLTFPLSVRSTVSVSRMRPTGTTPGPLPRCTVTLTVSRNCGLRFSSVSETWMNMSSRMR